MPSAAALKWSRRLAVATAVLVGLWLLAWAAGPPLVRAQLERRASAALGRPVTVGAVSLKPWALELTLRDVSVGAAPGAAAATPLLQVARLHANADWQSLWRWAPVLSQLEIDAPRVHVARTAPGRYDIDDLIDRYAQPSPQPAGDDGAPARFAVHNVALRDGAIVFDDRPAGRRHEVSELQLALPFLSSLASQVDVVVEPRLSFRLGDTRFDTGAQSTPFAPDRETRMTLRMSELDLAPLRPYLPADLPVALQRGRAKAEVSLRFERRDDGTSALSLSGSLDVLDTALADRTGAPLAGWKALRLQVADAEPLSRRVALGTVRLEGLRLAVTREADGGLNLARLLGAGPIAGRDAAAGGVQRAPAASSAASSTAARRTSGPSPWRISVQSVELGDARVSWSDAAVQPAAALSLDGIEARMGPWQWPSDRPAPLALKARLAANGNTAGPPATLEAEGDAGPARANVALKLAGVPLAAFAPYVRAALRPPLEGTAAAEGTITWAADPSTLSLDVRRAAVDDLRMVDPSAGARRDEAAPRREPGRRDEPRAERRAPRRDERRADGTAAGGRRSGTGREPVGWKSLVVESASVDWISRTARIGRAALVQPRLALERAADGSVNAAAWLGRDEAAAPAAAAPSAALPDGAAPRPWRITLAEAAMQDGRVRWRDEAPGDPTPGAGPVRLNVSAIEAAATGVAWPASGPPADLRLSAVVSDPAAPRGSRREQGGTVEWRGRVGAEPLALAGALRVERFPLHALEPYFGDAFHATVQRAEGHWRGDVALRRAPAGMEASASGDLGISELHVRARDPATGALSTDELLSWRSLQVRTLKLAMAPNAKPAIDVGEAVVSDFYSQLVVTEQGRFNLRDVRAAQTGDPSPPGGFAVGRQIAAPAGEAASAPAGSPSASAPAASASAGPSAAAASTVTSAPADPSDGLPVELRVGGIQLVNGRIDYTDRFVRPNYSAALSELNGRLGAFEAGSRQMATLELDGRAAGTARLEIRGSLNPTADPLALDVRAKATDLELAPLSPYAGKYAGYAIERGKLSMDVHYRVQPDGRLEASNRVVLNQLTFGERIESPDATTLPVRLAVALLKDRHGVIDVNLPVSGSLNDPQFSVAGIIARVIGNLIAKALTSPFSLLAGVGGGEDLSTIGFQPGTATPDDAAGAVIDKVARALQERPSVQMTVTGSADPAREADALRRQALERRLAAQRRNEAVRAGRPAAAEGPMPPQERERLLRAVYRDTELPDKPRNVLGLEKDLPAAEMEALLLKVLDPGPDAARDLALQRGVAVRDALVARGLPSERLFLAAPRLGDEPQAKLALSLR